MVSGAGIAGDLTCLIKYCDGLDFIAMLQVLSQAKAGTCHDVASSAMHPTGVSQHGEF